MSNSTPVRKSGRQRVPSKKAREEVTELLEDLLSESEHASAIGLGAGGTRLSEDQDFCSEGPNTAFDLANTELETDSDMSGGSQVATPVDDSDHDADGINGKSRRPSRAHVVRKRTGARRISIADHMSKGVLEDNRMPSTGHGRVAILAGPRQAQIEHLLKMKKIYAKYPTLPHGGTFEVSCIGDQDERDREASFGWKWYYDEGGRNFFQRVQRKQRNGKGEGGASNRGSLDEVRLLLGPYAHQKLCTLANHRFLRVREEWPAIEEDGEVRTNAEHSETRNWILYAGARVTCLDWALRRGGQRQYLVIGINPSSNLPNQDTMPGATASETLPTATLQIWSIQTATPQDVGTDTPPSEELHLEQKFSTTWGYPQQLKWCPIPQITRDGSSRDETSLGLLASIWSDGGARILDVDVNQTAPKTTKSWCYNTAAFTIKARGTQCTCICWLSPSDLCVGHANGFIALYNVYPPEVTRIAAEFQPEPFRIIPPIQPGPLLCITSAYPTHPTLLASSSLSGSTRLLDLRRPMSDTILSSRSRVAPTTLAYSPHLLSMIAGDEPSQKIRSIGLRCWNSPIAIGNVSVDTNGPGQYGGGLGAIGRGCLDTGKVHSCIAWGMPDGKVVVSNPVIRILGGSKTFVSEQVICRQEWVKTGSVSPASDEVPPNTEPLDEQNGGAAVNAMNDGENGQDDEHTAPKPIRTGISRFTEGYKPEKVEFHAKHSKTRTTTLFEEETAVTAVSWNPNLDCGGWLAMAWGSGLVRIKDVAV